MSDLQLYDTLRRKKVVFEPAELKGPVRLYTCGPTVYDFAHLGNFRAYVFEDLLRRVLEAKGYKVLHVMNITDVDDKTIAGARRESCDLSSFTRRYEQVFFEELDLLRIKRPTLTPRATENLGDMQKLISILLTKDLAYERDGSVYYRVKSFAPYGRLSGKDLDRNLPGARVDQDEYDKEQVADFALWKKAKEGEPAWDSPWGRGRPGWHIECSAMSMKHLGSETIDLHAGGEDLIFPHHENEIAQSEGATGKPFVRFWLHCKFLVVEGEKMSKSKDNFYTLRDLAARGANPMAVRYLLLATHYRSPLNFTFDALQAADQACHRLTEFWTRLRETPAEKGHASSDLLKACDHSQERFWAALNDDLNISEALGELFSLVAEANRALDERALELREKERLMNFLAPANGLLDVIETAADFVPHDAVALAEARLDARKRGDFKRADELRKMLTEKGFEVRDSEDGFRIRPVRKRS